MREDQEAEDERDRGFEGVDPVFVLQEHLDLRQVKKGLTLFEFLMLLHPVIIFACRKS